jgi:MGT family glycosyltransferase
MSRILIAVSPFAGHVTPMLPVACHLASEGHEIFFQTSDTFAETIKAAGLSFLPLHGTANWDYHKLDKLVPQLWTASDPVDQFNIYVKHVLADFIPDQYLGLQKVIAEKKIDLVLTDVLFFGEIPLLLSGERRPPVISFGVIAPSWIDPGFSIYSGPNPAPDGQERNAADNEDFLNKRQLGYSYVDRILDGLGITIPGGFTQNSVYRLPDVFIQLGVEAFEYPMQDRPDNLIFSGPLLSTKHSGEAPPWLDKLDRSLPLVLVTQGTLANYDFNQLVNPALEALADEPVQVVVTAGGSKHGTLKPAGNAVIESYVPYEQVLPMASVFITNGGYNGVQQALSYGVPLVACGMSEDKPIVMARVAWSGAGVVIPGGRASAEELRNAVRTVLTNPGYREHAQAIGSRIAKTDAPVTISQVVREALASNGIH